ncbi:UDP-glucose--hexose-1-phosphate uridylyltransferase [Fructilactobacillus sp. Tb1]|uniref:UDP-glucose--hexose-1-phosphate uridylyltransferase n=1 Tax=Fructilactobacillus sp. Tb1 TaxID=3422304 RepID=UPI003D2DB105
MNKTNLVEQYAKQVIETGSTYQNLDYNYLVNQIYALVGETNVDEELATKLSLLELAQRLIEIALKNQKISNTLFNREQLEEKLTNLYTPRPSIVNAKFWNAYKQTPSAATDYFYNLSKLNNYIKTAQIKKNISYQVATDFGNLEITINLSKPEKDPKDIAKAAETKTSDYPKCNLCMQNEGYHGNPKTPIRINHRIVNLLIDGQPWGFQYSPYAYFEQHCIFLNQKHLPMIINQQTFSNLLEIITMFPTYFVGSNADLPIVGGSILSHEHYQGGKHDFPMMKAKPRFTFNVDQYAHVKSEVLKWPMSVIRLTSDNKIDLINMAELIRQKWNHYSDKSVGVIANSDGKRHHTLTPIAKKNTQDEFELYLVLRDNNVSSQYPDGIFHPHQEYQHIKKENIGLIEVMGRAILPARLKVELTEVEKYLLNEPNKIAEYHLTWAKTIKQNYKITKENVSEIIDKEVGIVFMHVLENAGVFKLNDKGNQAFQKFIATLNEN